MNYLNFNASTVFGWNKDLSFEKKNKELLNELEYDFKKIKYYIERNYHDSYFYKTVINDISSKYLDVNDYAISYFLKENYRFLIFNPLNKKLIKPSFILIDKDYVFTNIQQDVFDNPQIDYFLIDSSIQGRNEFVLECLSYF